MPRMPKYLKREWAFFLDERGRKKYNELCRKCERSCKQSFVNLPFERGKILFSKGFSGAYLRDEDEGLAFARPFKFYADIREHTRHTRCKAPLNFFYVLQC